MYGLPMGCGQWECGVGGMLGVWGDVWMGERDWMRVGLVERLVGG